MTKRGQGRTPEQYREYMRNLMRDRRAGKWVRKTAPAAIYVNKAAVTAAAYDPRRDGAPIYETPSAELLGDPPIGRSALDQKEPR